MLHYKYDSKLSLFSKNQFWLLFFLLLCFSPQTTWAMNKNELISAMADSAGVSKADARLALNTYLRVVTQGLKNGNKISLVGFGTFSVSTRAPRTTNNNRPTKPKVPSKTVVRFKAGSELSEKVNRRTLLRHEEDEERKLQNDDKEEKKEYETFPLLLLPEDIPESVAKALSVLSPDEQTKAKQELALYKAVDGGDGVITPVWEEMANLNRALTSANAEVIMNSYSLIVNDVINAEGDVSIEAFGTFTPVPIDGLKDKYMLEFKPDEEWNLSILYDLMIMEAVNVINEYRYFTNIFRQDENLENEASDPIGILERIDVSSPLMEEIANEINNDVISSVTKLYLGRLEQVKEEVKEIIVKGGGDDGDGTMSGAGRELRRRMQDLKGLAQDIRAEVTTIKNEK